MQEFLYKLQLVRGDMLRTGPTERNRRSWPSTSPISRASMRKASSFCGPHPEYRRQHDGAHRLPRRIRRRRPPDHEEDPASKEGADDGDACIRSKSSCKESKNSKSRKRELLLQALHINGNDLTLEEVREVTRDSKTRSPVDKRPVAPRTRCARGRQPRSRRSRRARCQ
jgi:hypothetical protein